MRRFPETITTSRLVLQRWRVDDAERLKAALDSNKDHLVPWIPWATGEEADPGWVAQQLQRMVGEFDADQTWSWAITLPGQPGVIGGCGLHDRIGSGGLEVGYWLDHDHLGRGLASEAAAVLVELARADAAVDRVEMHVDERNRASARIPDRLGFEPVESQVRTDRWGDQVTIVIWRWPPGRHPGIVGMRSETPTPPGS